MKFPVFFELDGKFGGMLSTSDNGVLVILSTGAPGISILMNRGSEVTLEKTSETYRSLVDNVILNM